MKTRAYLQHLARTCVKSQHLTEEPGVFSDCTAESGDHKQRAASQPPCFISDAVLNDSVNKSFYLTYSNDSVTLKTTAL